MFWEYLLVAFIPCSFGYKSFYIGGLFEGGDGIESAFGLSVAMIDKYRSTNPNYSKKIMLHKSIEVDKSLWNVQKRVCELVQLGVAGIFGPQNEASIRHVHSMCDTLGIPHISATMDTDDTLKILNLYPHARTLSMCYYNIVSDYKWKSYTILYDSDISLFMMSPLLQKWNSTGYPVTILPLIAPNYRETLHKVKISGEENIIIDCSISVLPEVLKQALQVGLISERFHLIITSLDLQTINYEPYQYSGMNITGLRMVDPENSEVNNTIRDFSDNFGSYISANELSVNQALMYDAVQLFALAFKQMNDAIRSNIRSLPCDGSEYWEHGDTLINYIRSVEMQGLTGLVKFDITGYRTDFQIDILSLGDKGLEKVGVWNSTQPIKWIPKTVPENSDAVLTLHNMTFNVLISLTDPYAMLKESSVKRIGNDRFEGFAIDIIEELSKMLGFNYTFMVQDDKDYGTYNNKTGKWKGMIGKVMAGLADLAITDLTITQQRESLVDLTLPFMSLGISILYKKPTKAEASMMSFMSTFSNEVWYYLVAAYIFVSMELFVIGRICPSEWVNPYPCIEEPSELKNQLSFRNCLWFTLGAMMQQGSEIAPAGVSTRMLAGVWFFFCLIMVTSYTANLAASLTVEVAVAPFHNVRELAKQNKIKYGAKRGGSTLAFFQTSNDSVYKHMYQVMMKDQKNLLTNTNEEGRDKVLAEDYAFFMESTTIEYQIERNCTLAKVGDLLDEKGYGIAMKKNAPYRHELSSAILALQENGKLSALKVQWWTQKRGGGSCEQKNSGQPAELNLKNVGGVYLVLFIGITISLLWTFMELLLHVAAVSQIHNLSFKEELISELKFVIQFNNSTKAVRRKNGSSSKSRASTADCVSISTLKTICEETV